MRAAPARVAVEHSFGILKARWSCLRNMRFKLRTLADEAHALAAAQACFVLHNMFVNTYRDVISAAEIKAALEEEQPLLGRIRQEAVTARYEFMTWTTARRELLVKEMIAWDPPNNLESMRC